MASHTFCRARPLKQSVCSAADALGIVQDLLNLGTSSLPDDLRTNLYHLESELLVLAKISDALASGRAAARQQAAAKDPGIPEAPNVQDKHDKEVKKKKKKRKESASNGPVPSTGKKEHKEAQKKDNKKEKRKRSMGAGDADAEEEKNRKAKKQKK